MNIDAIPLDLLRSFVAFVESPNMVAAANRLRLSQPLLTKHLQILEEASAQPIFSFEGRKKVCTRYGHSLYEVIKGHLEGLQNSLQDLSLRQSDPSRMLLRIGGRKEILETICDRIPFPGKIHFLPMSGAETLQALQAGKLDIGISQHELDSHSFMRKLFFKDRFRIVAPNSWGLRSQKTVELLKELQERPYLSYGASDPLMELYQFHGLELDIEAHRSFPSWTMIIEMIRQGTGWALTPQLFLKDKKGLQLIEIPDKAISRTEFNLYYPREFSHNSWFQDVAKSILKTVQ